MPHVLDFKKHLRAAVGMTGAAGDKKADSFSGFAFGFFRPNATLKRSPFGYLEQFKF